MITGNAFFSWAQSELGGEVARNKGRWIGLWLGCRIEERQVKEEGRHRWRKGWKQKGGKCAMVQDG